MNNQPSLQDLRLFCQVARAASFASTARTEGVSPAFVSKRIAALEASLQTRLFHRTTRAISLTEDGENILRWSLKILEDIEQMQDSIARARTTLTGTLRISTSTGFGRNRLAPAISEFMRRYPQLGVQMELIDRSVDLIGEGFDVDIRLGAASGRETDLLVQHLARNWRVLCASPSYLARAGTPARLSDLASHSCIVIRERDQSGSWRLTGPNGSETVRVPMAISANNGEIVHQWGIDGHGIFLRSIWDVAEDLRTGRLAHVLPKYRQEADVVAIYAHRLDRSGRLRVCIQFLKHWFKDHPLS